MEGPEFFAGASEISAADNHRLLFDQKPADQNFAIDDLLDFSNSVDEDFPMISADSFYDSVAGNSSDSSALTVVGSCNSSFSAADSCVPVIQYDDLAELEWLSNFVEDSFSTDKDLQSLQFLSTAATATSSPKPLTPETSSSSSCCSEPPRNEQFFPHETSLRGKARSKRSRAAPGDWTTRLLHLVHPDGGGDVAKQGRNRSAGVPESGGGRKCLHCAAEKTPQWRTGPAGPKTLCNACGVRYKSGRLVPEYRPASSPTFVSAKHSNSHRKVMELRRQKELHTVAHHRRHSLGQTSIFGVSDGCDDFLIHHHGGSDFGRLI